jgi:hypothetical protein
MNSLPTQHYTLLKALTCPYNIMVQLPIVISCWYFIISGNPQVCEQYALYYVTTTLYYSFLWYLKLDQYNTIIESDTVASYI